MFAVLLEYMQPLDAVDRLKDQHIAFLKAQYEKGHFLVSGPRCPRTGGFILAGDMSRQELDAILAQDPFYRERVAAYQVIEFAATMHAEGMPF